MLFYDLAALGAATCWALSSIIGATPSRQLGSFGFTRVRLSLLTLLLGGIALASGGWQLLNASQLALLAASGLTGIFLGDTLMFAAMNRIGPRRTGLLFATHSVFSVSLGVLLLSERLSLAAAAGSLLVFAGVLCAIAFGRRDSQQHHWEHSHGLKLGVALALTAALCQALGTFLAKPVMAAGIDPIAANGLRIAVSCAAHWLLWASGNRHARLQSPLAPRLFGQTVLNGLVGQGVGMTLVMLALKGGNVATVGILTAMTPVLILPMLWAVMGQRPPALAWLGAAASVAGSMLIVLR
ncbi:DMT family transporter [Vogesella facilis]|uniref:DMT family transporter n=1 Tax=Vogesella facilis TaxID=1655232 RepID=A0ABV7RD57_9NEIS